MPIRQPSDFLRVSSVHILHITPYFPPTWSYGGIPRIVSGLSAAQAKLGARVSVMTTDAYDKERRSGVPQVRKEGSVEVYTLKNRSNRLAYNHQLFLPIGMPAALESLSPPDVIHMHGHRHLLNNYAYHYARRGNIKTLLYPTNC